MELLCHLLKGFDKIKCLTVHVHVTTLLRPCMFLDNNRTLEVTSVSFVEQTIPKILKGNIML